MSRADVPRVDDMLEATVEIAAIVERGRGAYDQDVALRRAIERCLEILGEDQEMAGSVRSSAVTFVRAMTTGE